MQTEREREKKQSEPEKALDEKELAKVQGAGPQYTLEKEDPGRRSGYHRVGPEGVKRSPFATPG